MALLGCAVTSCDAPPRQFTAVIAVFNEDDTPIAGASVDIGTEVRATDGSGQVVLDELDGPVLAIVSSVDHLPEPVVIGRSDREQSVRVRLFAAADGKRWVMHSGGDVMFARRYVEPTWGEALVPESDIAGGTRQVAAPLGRAFAAANLRTINLATVLSDRTEPEIAAGLRQPLNSRPEALAGLSALGADVAVLANDRIRDYLDPGIADTMAALEAANIAHVGAYDSDPALARGGTVNGEEHAVFAVGNARVAVAAYSTVTGARVNDGFPRDGVPAPDPLEPGLSWQYQARMWGYDGGDWGILSLARRIGSAWEAFTQLETQLSDPADVAAVWASLVEVYPELQDWVAGRGHGGAARWQNGASTAAISALADAADVVVVQLHSSYSYRDAPSSVTREVARLAIDAGADIVVAHHPHVLQGAEWYKGRLIVYSLGNLAFDHDIMATFPGAFLRTVWEGSSLLEARFIPFEIDGYRPLPAADGAARRTALALWEKSASHFQAERAQDGVIYPFAVDVDSDTQPAHVRVHNHDAVITDSPPSVDRFQITVPPGQIAPLHYAGLTLPASDHYALEVGRDLLGWGHFEDVLADGETREGTHWLIDSGSERTLVDVASGQGVGYLRLKRRSSADILVATGPVAHIAMPEHRLYGDAGGVVVPRDSEARYSLFFLARRYGGIQSTVELQFFRDNDLGYGPDDGAEVGRWVIPFSVPDDGDWHRVELDIPEAAHRPANGEPMANKLLLYVQLEPPRSSIAYLDIDDVAVIEWRLAPEIPDHFALYDFVRNTGAEELEVAIHGLPLSH